MKILRFHTRDSLKYGIFRNTIDGVNNSLAECGISPSHAVASTYMQFKQGKHFCGISLEQMLNEGIITNKLLLLKALKRRDFCVSLVEVRVCIVVEEQVFFEMNHINKVKELDFSEFNKLYESVKKLSTFWG